MWDTGEAAYKGWRQIDTVIISGDNLFLPPKKTPESILGLDNSYSLSKDVDR